MNTLEKKVDNQVQFWSLVGPFVILLSMAVLLFKSSSYWYLPLTALAAMPICVKWKVKGLAVSLTFLLTLAFMTYQDLPMSERFWHMGIALSMAFTLIILTLSLEEVQGLLVKVQVESQSRLENFLRLDEALKSKEASWEDEQEGLQSKLKAITQELAQAKAEQLTFEKLTRLANEELVLLRTQHEHLIQEIFQRKQQIADLNEKLEELEVTLQGFVDGDLEQQIQQLQSNIEAYEQEIGQLKVQQTMFETQASQTKEKLEKELKEAQELVHLKEMEMMDKTKFSEELLKKTINEINLNHEMRVDLLKTQFEETKKALVETHEEAYSSLQEELNQIAAQKDQLSREVECLRQAQQELQRQINLAHEKDVEKLETQLKQSAHQENVLKGQIQEITERLKTAEKQHVQFENEIAELKRELEFSQKQLEQHHNRRAKLPYAPGNTRQMEAMYLQLREQFQEKSSILDTTRKELFHVQEQLLRLQKEQEEQYQFGISEADIRWQKDLNRLTEELEQSQKESAQELELLYNVVNALLKQLPAK